jgi:hypothetical protein
MNKARLAAVSVLAAIGLSLVGCSYGGTTASGDNAVITRNDMFLFGALRKVYVCKVTEGGLSGCREGEAP